MTAATQDSLWIRSYHPAPEAAITLLCFPHAGGSASYFHPVSAALSPRVEVLATQYPGRQDRGSEPLIDDLTVLADRLVDLVAARAGKPLALFGHSMGASLAFEVARRLERRGVTPSALFVSGRRAPTAPRDERQHLGTDAELVAEMKRLSGTDSRLLDDEDIVAMVLPWVRNDYKAAETYRYQDGPDVSCPVVAMVGDADPKATAEEVGAWRRHTSGAFELVTFPGGHFYLNDQNAAVLRVLTDRLGVTP
ncbi:thioesterase II family protein [Amycolatopsis sp. H20-H5]|uniref:thioesterase II family protein n=1 Tax=Amycolatopsis sp. H20-H5 TaxID=3046309 RepID=UPI002DBC6C10|nr:alpha/beta fold hydrolase [Amycolatopsis sp. H20-H5]MEC3976073.1 alpha/beta fold hydrolase [Amycolatopsis sp. H20-H5]